MNATSTPAPGRATRPDPGCARLSDPLRTTWSRSSSWRWRVVVVLTALLAAVFSSPDEKSITLADWANKAPNDVVATAAGELAGTTTSAEYGAPYNTAGSGQVLGPLALQRWAGVRIPVDSAQDLVITPLRGVSGDPH